MNELQFDIPQEQTTSSTGADDWAQLLRSAGEGDESALGEICERLHRYLLSIVPNQIGTRLRSKLSDSDVVQQTMIDVCQGFASLRATTEQQCRAWIKQCLRRNILDAARKYHQTQQRLLSRERVLDGHLVSNLACSDSQTASRILLKKENDEELLKAVERLPPQQRRVIELRHRHGMSYAQIAATLDITEVAARKCWSRAVSTLGRGLTR